MDANILHTILSDKSLLVMLLAPGLLFAGVTFFCLFYLVKTIGNRIALTYDEQTRNFKEFSDNIKELVFFYQESRKRDEALEVTLKKISNDIDLLKNILIGRDRNDDKRRNGNS